jgi:ubiquinol oxidase
LSNDAVWAREHARPQVESPLIIKLPYLALCVMLDKLFDGRPISRFWFLETVARMPYYSYLNMLQAYETLGLWKSSAVQKRVHFAEEWNEYHHLLIMEALGGDLQWKDRFLAQHAGFAYYWVLVLLWLLSPSLAYNFSELIEAHAVDTYAEFAEANKERLKAIPAPVVAKAYYNGACLWMFDEFQTDGKATVRRPKIETLYDTFCAIRDDEGEHVKTMHVCQDDSAVLASPNAEKAAAAASSLAALMQAPGVRDLLAKLTLESTESTELIGELFDQLSVDSTADLVVPLATFLGENLPNL